MASLNQCSFIGRLGKDPERQVTSTDKPVTKFSLAVDQGKDQTMWLNITCWDKLAETVEKYARKGTLVFVQGKLQLRRYKEKQHNVERISVEIIATTVQLLEKRKAEDEIPDEVLPEA